MSPPVTVAVTRLPEGEGLPLPAYMTPGAAGADVVAAVPDQLVLAPGDRAVVPTGFALEVPAGYEVLGWLSPPTARSGTS